MNNKENNTKVKLVNILDEQDPIIFETEEEEKFKKRQQAIDENNRKFLKKYFENKPLSF